MYIILIMSYIFDIFESATVTDFLEIDRRGKEKVILKKLLLHTYTPVRDLDTRYRR